MKILLPVISVYTKESYINALVQIRQYSESKIGIIEFWGATMTNSNDRLRDIETILAQTSQRQAENTLAIQNLRLVTAENADAITRNREDIAQLVTATQGLLTITQIQQTNFEATLSRIDAMQREIKEMQTEIRGLQLENRRLFERFFPPEEN